MCKLNADNLSLTPVLPTHPEVTNVTVWYVSFHTFSYAYAKMSKYTYTYLAFSYIRQRDNNPSFGCTTIYLAISQFNHFSAMILFT